MARTKSILIIGGSGFIGSRLALHLRDQHRVYATYRTHVTSMPGVSFIPLDVENENWVKRVVYSARPDVIIYCAGRHDTDWVEANPAEADKVHVGGLSNVGNASDLLQPKLIYISTNYVFDGNRGNYKESDPALAFNMLGKMKLAGENFVRSRFLDHLIIRTPPVIGRGNGRQDTFLDKLRRSLDQSRRIELPNYEVHSYSVMKNFIDTVERCIETGTKVRTMNCGGISKITPFDFGKRFAECFDFNPGLVVDKARPQPQDGTKEDDRIRDYSLNVGQAFEQLKIKPLLLEECFDLMQKELIP